LKAVTRESAERAAAPSAPGASVICTLGE
jgi:hypothetical protein